MEPEEAFGIVLRELRTKHSLSQESLAHDAGLERNYISLLELGRNSASIKTLFKLTPILGVTATEFMRKVEAKLRKTQES